MIKIIFAEPTSSSWSQWLEMCEKEQEAHNQIIEAGGVSKVKSNIYKGTQFNIKADIYLNPVGPFRGKCAYCEQKIYSDQHGDLDHFRPKGAVADENYEPVMIAVDGEVKDHPGYYWLCYNWKNLLPSCTL
jgi:hypothetical protein